MNKKISSEFALAVIFIIAGTLGYIFWKGQKDFKLPGDRTEKIIVDKKVITSDEGDSKNEKWKLFRNSRQGYEFSLPQNWSLKEETGKFVAEDEAAEIEVVIEENLNNYSVDTLLAETDQSDSEVNVRQLSELSGIFIEKNEAESLVQTAKILQGNDVITLTYFSQGNDRSNNFFQQVIPTIRSVN